MSTFYLLQQHECYIFDLIISVVVYGYQIFINVFLRFGMHRISNKRLKTQVNRMSSQSTRLHRLKDKPAIYEAFQIRKGAQSSQIIHS